MIRETAKYHADQSLLSHGLITSEEATPEPPTV
jgi:hypothetical protein